MLADGYVSTLGALVAVLVGGWLVLGLLITRAVSRRYSLAVVARGDRTVPRNELAPADVERFCDDGPQNSVECFTSALGLKVAVYAWHPVGPLEDRPKAMILYCPGLDSCADIDLCKRGRLRDGLGYKGSWLEHLNEAGYLVYSFDYNGMGHSESTAQGWPSMCFDYQDYVDEVLQLRFLLGRRHPDLKCVLLGGSMGACVGLNAAQQRPDAFDLCVFVCPALSFDKLKAVPANRVLLPLLALISALFPYLPLGTKAVPDPDAHAEEVAVGLPIFNCGNLRARYAEHGLAFGEKALLGASKVTQPLLLLHAKDDDFADFKGSQLLLQGASSLDKTLLDDLDGHGHGLIRADASVLDRKFIKKITAWIDARL